MALLRSNTILASQQAPTLPSLLEPVQINDIELRQIQEQGRFKDIFNAGQKAAKAIAKKTQKFKRIERKKERTQLALPRSQATLLTRSLLGK